MRKFVGIRIGKTISNDNITKDTQIVGRSQNSSMASVDYQNNYSGQGAIILQCGDPQKNIIVDFGGFLVP